MCANLANVAGNVAADYGILNEVCAHGLFRVKGWVPVDALHLTLAEELMLYYIYLSPTDGCMSYSHRTGTIV